MPNPELLASVPPWVGYLLPALGLFLLSTCVAALNEVIRQRDASGVPVSPRLRLVASILNVIAANHDKAKQQLVAAKVEPSSAAKSTPSLLSRAAI